MTKTWRCRLSSGTQSLEKRARARMRSRTRPHAETGREVAAGATAASELEGSRVRKRSRAASRSWKPGGRQVRAGPRGAAFGGSQAPYSAFSLEGNSDGE